MVVDIGQSGTSTFKRIQNFVVGIEIDKLKFYHLPRLAPIEADTF